MIKHPAFVVEPWRLRASSLDLARLAQVESLFAVGNGNLGWRATLDEGVPVGIPGTYLAGVYERHRLSYAEGGFGYPDSTERIVNVTDGKIVRLTVGGEPLDVRTGRVNDHDLTLDFRSGTYCRRLDWTSPRGHRVRVTSTRMVSLTRADTGVIDYVAEAVDGPVDVQVVSTLTAREHVPPRSGDPRDATGPPARLHPVSRHASGTDLRLVQATRSSGLVVAAVCWHDVVAPAAELVSDASDHEASLTATTRLDPGQSLRVVKYLSYGHGAATEDGPWRVQERAVVARDGARHAGLATLLAEQRRWLDDFWERNDIEVDGDPMLQQAARYSVYQLAQAAANTGPAPIPAKGLTGPGYDGHTFWDSEVYLVPALLHLLPEAAERAVRWRASTLTRAAERARLLGLDGACFPWRTITGRECSGYWPAGLAALHINADIADAALRCARRRDDPRFDTEAVLPIVVQTARLWLSAGWSDADGVFHIDGVTGPDEYSAIVDDNVYTNLGAAQALLAAAELAEAHPAVAARLRVTAEEAARWRRAGENVCVPFDRDRGVHSQDADFTRHERWDFSRTAAEQYPLFLHHPYQMLYRKQIVKQADLVLAMQLHPRRFTDEQRRANFDYYEPLTVRDSSLSASAQAVVAAQCGYHDLAYEYLCETALIDLDNLEHNTRDGLHLAAIAGIVNVLLEAFGGITRSAGGVSMNPRVPAAIAQLRFRVDIGGAACAVTLTASHARYALLGATGRAEFLHHGRPVALSAGEPVTLPLPPREPRPAPPQPPCRSPRSSA